ncbi:MAG: hypothetical protein K2I93_06485 [Oscillospiraceae bacterium]|nr:hypothetical protein [Oscillospiraceae bacterium]
MKKVISALTVAAMCASMAASAMPAFAIYKGGEVGSYLKVVSADKGTISEDGKTITFATAADAASAKITIDQYLVCDTESVSIQKINCAFTADNTAITLGDGVSLNDTDYKPEEVEYTVNGKTFKTSCMVNCFAWLNKRGVYKTGCGASQMNSSTEGTSKLEGKGDNSFVVTAWNSDFGDTVNYPDTYKETAHFMDTKSDSLPFMEFSATIGDSIADGTYTVDFLPEYKKDGEATQGCFIITGDGKTTVSFGTLEGITIKVGDKTDQTDPQPTDPNATPPLPP